MVRFGERLKSLRISKRMTQKQLADRIYVQHSQISQYETGLRLPSPDTIIRITAVFHVSSDFLLGIEKREAFDVSGLDENDRKLVQSLIQTLRAKNKLVQSLIQTLRAKNKGYGV